VASRTGAKCICACFDAVESRPRPSPTQALAPASLRNRCTSWRGTGSVQPAFASASSSRGSDRAQIPIVFFLAPGPHHDADAPAPTSAIATAGAGSASTRLSARTTRVASPTRRRGRRRVHTDRHVVAAGRVRVIVLDRRAEHAAVGNRDLDVVECVQGRREHADGLHDAGDPPTSTSSPRERVETPAA